MNSFSQFLQNLWPNELLFSFKSLSRKSLFFHPSNSWTLGLCHIFQYFRDEECFQSKHSNILITEFWTLLSQYRSVKKCVIIHFGYIWSSDIYYSKTACVGSFLVILCVLDYISHVDTSEYLGLQCISQGLNDCLWLDLKYLLCIKISLYNISICNFK